MAYSTSTLAQGCFGKVYKEKYNDTWAAIKKVPHHLINKKDLERECEVYNKAKHTNIVKLLGNITLTDGKWIIPLEFIFGEDLETTIFRASKSKIKLTPPNKGTIIIGMCEGLLHLHSKDIVHQDLKPENIMVEHNTNRAIIIDLGLAKFFRRGLSSAIDMGNEAYSAPEVLQRSSQRDQRSDVWAMGKIIAELCARVRLYTPSVSPAKIKETLKDQPFCSAVCRMVESDPSLRASMSGVISEIRASAADIVTQSGNLQVPSSHSNARSRSLSPMPSGRSPVRRAHSPFYQDPSPTDRSASPHYADSSAVNRDPSPMTRGRSPVRRAHSPYYTDPSVLNRDPSPMTRGRSPVRRAHSPYYTDPSPANRDPSPMNRAHSPYYTDPSVMNRDPSPMNRAHSPYYTDPLAKNRNPSPINRAHSPYYTDPSSMNRASSSSNRDLSPHYRSSSPEKWEHSFKPEVKVVIPEAPKCPSSSSQGTEDRKQYLVSTGGSDVMQDFTKMKMYEEAAKDLPCNLPTTGRIVVQRFEEKNGEVESWEQKEVVTRNGKIVKYDDVRFNSK